MNTLLEINRDPEIQKVTLVTMIGPMDVTAFLDGTTGPPPLQPLRPYWDMIQSPWNHHLANEFATVFMNNYSQDIVTTHDEVAEYFIQRLDTLRKHISKRVPRWEGETAAEIEERVMAEGKVTRENTRRRGRLERVSSSFHSLYRRFNLVQSDMMLASKSVWTVPTTIQIQLGKSCMPWLMPSERMVKALMKLMVSIMSCESENGGVLL